MMQTFAFIVCACNVLLRWTTDAAVSGWTGLTLTTVNGAVVSGTNSKVEGSTGTLFTLVATGQTSTAWSFGPSGNPGSIADATITNGAVALAAGKSLDYETKTSYVFIIVATEGDDTGTATVTLSITNKLEFSSATLTGCVVAGAAASSVVGTYVVSDAAKSETVTYTLAGTNSASFAMAASTGVLSVGSTALAATVNTTYVLTLSATGTSSAASDTVTLALTSATTCASDSDSDSGAAQLSRVLVVLLLSVLTAVSM